MDHAHIRTQILALAQDMLAPLGVPAGQPVTVTIASGHDRIVISSEPGRAPPTGAALGLTPTCRDILRVLTFVPQPSKRLAVLAGHRLNSHFRHSLAWLCEHGHARRSSRGYSLPDK